MVSIVWISGFCVKVHIFAHAGERLLSDCVLILIKLAKSQINLVYLLVSVVLYFLLNLNIVRKIREKKIKCSILNLIIAANLFLLEPPSMKIFKDVHEMRLSRQASAFRPVRVFFTIQIALNLWRWHSTKAYLDCKGLLVETYSLTKWLSHRQSNHRRISKSLVHLR